MRKYKSQYQPPWGLKKPWMPWAKPTTQAVCELAKKVDKMDGNCRMAWAKISGIMPDILTISGKVPFTGIDMRLPMRRPGYMTGTLRRPCCTYTIANTVMRITMTVKISINQRVDSSASRTAMLD